VSGSQINNDLAKGDNGILAQANAASSILNLVVPTLGGSTNLLPAVTTPQHTPTLQKKQTPPPEPEPDEEMGMVMVPMEKVRPSTLFIFCFFVAVRVREFVREAKFCYLQSHSCSCCGVLRTSLCGCLCSAPV
jgi:hypothetical protein